MSTMEQTGARGTPLVEMRDIRISFGACGPWTG